MLSNTGTDGGKQKKMDEQGIDPKHNEPLRDGKWFVTNHRFF